MTCGDRVCMHVILFFIVTPLHLFVGFCLFRQISDNPGLNGCLPSGLADTSVSLSATSMTEVCPSPSSASGSSSVLPMIAGGVCGALLLAALGVFCWWKTRKGHNSQVTCNNYTIMSTTHHYATMKTCMYRQGTQHLLRRIWMGLTAPPPVNPPAAGLNANFLAGYKYDIYNPGLYTSQTARRKQAT
jgi:hypothetical protein